MSLLPIKIYPDPILREVAAEVTDFDESLGAFLDNMAETMYHANGIGLAANQVGVLKRVVVIDVSEDRKGLLEIINPKIVNMDGSTPSEEGCLSIPEYRDTIKRKELLDIEAVNRHGEPFTIKAEGLLAVCLQHEIDHLNGVLFIDHLSRLKRELFRRWHKKHGAVGDAHDK